jgi:hypothetical protein
MNFEAILGRLLNLDNVHSIESVEPSLAAPWAHNSSGWLFFGCLALSVLAVLFYFRCQHGGRSVRVVLAVFRALVLSLVLLALAEPLLTIKVASRTRPALWLLFDGTDSMGIADDLAGTERTELIEAVGLDKPSSTAAADDRKPARMEYVKSLLQNANGELLSRLAEKFRLRAFLFDQPNGARALESAAGPSQQLDPKTLASQLTTGGKVTALGAALNDLSRRFTTTNLAGVVVFSDFQQNSGPPALEAARRLGVPIHTVGVGPTATVDVAVELRAPLMMKKDERSIVTATVRQQGLDDREVMVRFSTRQLGGTDDESVAVQLAEKPVTLSGPLQDVEFAYVPVKTGHYMLSAEVDPVEGEVVRENNRAEREVAVRDDFLRLLFVEYEPTWEWRFLKEVFYRDKLVGTQGFRTFLRSSDPRVRKNNDLFLPTMSPPRSEFFTYDVIFLSDFPSSALSSRFCQMTEEFVREFGGGLVVLAGSRFGPGQLSDTPLGAMLPVNFDRAAHINDRQPFVLRLTGSAEQYDFMQLGSSAAENRLAWANMGPLPWFQPVERLHPMATVLAEHPSQTCADGKTHQPLIAVRRYGRGEVVYLGFDETWRLRRKYGETYYRQFWGQLIHRLGLSHAMGSQKRFVVRTDRRDYQTDEQALLTIEAYNGDFEPLDEKDLVDHQLRGELILPRGAGKTDNIQPLSITQSRKGLFEARFTVFAGGEHRVRVFDPITAKPVEWTFRVTSTAVERQQAVRNVALQEAMAAETGGKSYDLRTVKRLAEEIRPPLKPETSIHIIALWNTWLCFAAVVGLLTGEWLLRKWVNLP